MIGKVIPIATQHNPPAPGVIRRLQRGQSMAEFAVSVTFLILIFSGVIDLGRAFYTRITMDSAVSEGAHWMAAYPGCVYYGAAFGDMSNVVNAPTGCQGTNSIFQRIRNESSLLLPSNVESVSLTSDSGTSIDQLVAGQTITISMVYKFPLLTPSMRFMFGDSMSLQVDAHEVIRGDTLPITTGLPSTYSPISTVQTVQLVTTSPTSPIQSDGTTAACYNGYSRIQFKEPASGTLPTRYKVYEANSGTGVLGTQVGSAIASSGSYGHIFTVTVGSPNRVISPTTGGNQLYGIQSELDSGSPVVTTTSDVVYILNTCTQVQPTLTSYKCSTPVGSPLSSASVTFTWTMPKSYAWSDSQPIDTYVDQYHLYSYDTGTSTQSSVATWAIGSLTTGADQWTLTSPSYTFSSTTDPLRTGQFRLIAGHSGTDYGLISDSGLDLTISCP